MAADGLRRSDAPRSSRIQARRQQRLPFPHRDAFVEQIHEAQFKKLPAGYQKLTQAEIEQIRQAPDACAADAPAGTGRAPRVRPAV